MLFVTLERGPYSSDPMTLYRHNPPPKLALVPLSGVGLGEGQLLCPHAPTVDVSWTPHNAHVYTCPWERPHWRCPPPRPLMEDQVYILKHLPTQALFQTTYPVKTVRATLSSVVRTAASPNELADLTGHGWEENDSPCGSHSSPLMAKPFIPHGLYHPPSSPACWSPFLLGW